MPAQPQTIHTPTGDVQLRRTLGERYDLRRRIGEGGMGTVFEATDRLTGERVAVKLLREELRQRANFVSRFQREARIMRRLQHKNIARYHDFGWDKDGELYLASELLEGETLGDLLQGGMSLNARQTMILAVQILDGLASAHARGVVHRDIKPDNLFLVDGGAHVKIIDFGLASAQGEATISAAGDVGGTPDYLAPERIRGALASAHSDLYSVGLVLYRMISGHLPFNEPTPIDTIVAHATRPAPPLRWEAYRVSFNLGDLIMSCLEKNPLARPKSAAAMRDAIITCLSF